MTDTNMKVQIKLYKGDQSGVEITNLARCLCLEFKNKNTFLL